MIYLYIPELEYLPFGKTRRNLIKRYFDSTPKAYYAVNCKYRPQLKDDPDLLKLLKSGYLKTVRIYLEGKISRRTFLVRNTH